MDYDELRSAIGEYGRLWDLGLKKQANSVMRSLVAEVDAIPSQNERDQLMLSLCAELFEGDDPPLKKNGCSMLPFGLNRLMKESLARKCEEGTLPWLRWYYELFRSDPSAKNPIAMLKRAPFGLNRLMKESLARKCEEGTLPWLRWYYELFRSDPSAKNPIAMLKRALELDDADQATVDLYFGKLLDWLWYGHHHFPEGCLYTKDEYDGLIEEGENLIRKFSVKPQMIAAFENHRALYRCWEEWKERNKEGDFAHLCDEQGVRFRPVGSYYY